MNETYNNKAIDVPIWFVKGLKFRGKWIADGFNTCEIINFNSITNLAKVKITTTTSEWTEDGWNLQHTIWGFNNGDYKRT